MSAAFLRILNSRKKTFWIVVIAVAACCAVAVCFLTIPKTSGRGADPFGRYYRVSDILYDCGPYSFSYTKENAPRYCLTDQKELLVSGDYLAMKDKNDNNWLNAGTFDEIALTSDNFDRYFLLADGSALHMRRGNESAWRLITSDLPSSVFYYLLMQDNGDVYLTCGYWDAPEKARPDPDETLICWVFALAEQAHAEMTAVITEINDDTLLVRPVEGSDARRVSDCFSVPIRNMPPSPEPRIGDTVEIEYNGSINTTYPAQLGEVYSIKVQMAAPLFHLEDGRYVLSPETEETSVLYLLIHEGKMTIVQDMAVSYQPSGRIARDGNRVMIDTKYADEDCRWIFQLIDDNQLKLMTEESVVPETIGRAAWHSVMVFTRTE